MLKNTLIFTILCAFSYLSGYAQQSPVPVNLEKKVDSLYKKKNFTEAAAGYISLALHSDFKLKTITSYYQAACCYSLVHSSDSAFFYLQKAIDAGLTDRKRALDDSDFETIHKDERWNKMIAKIKENKPKTNTDPKKANLITSDIVNFWAAYDKALKDTANFRAIMKAEYFDKGSEGMLDYMGLKVRSIDVFVQHIRSFPKFYAAIRGNTYAPIKIKADLVAAFKEMKAIYPEAKFPDVYFVIGAFTSGGTVSDNGLLIGINQFCDDPSIVKDELDPRTKRMFVNKQLLPGLVPHELIHFQQNGLIHDTTTLPSAIMEGMADFIGEKISGVNANEELYSWAKGKEKAIWTRFVPDMYMNRYSNWMANRQNSTIDNPADQGYWIGYQICKAYYNQSADKKQAVHDMLNIQDYRKFLKDSGWEQTVAAL